MLVLCGLFAVLPATSSATTAQGARRSCVQSHARVLLSDRDAAVYRIRIGNRRGPQIETRGCAFAGSRHSYLVWSEPAGEESVRRFDGIDHLVLRGTMIAYEKSFDLSHPFGTGNEDEEGPAEWRVIVRDLRGGRTIHDVTTGPSNSAHPKEIGDGRAFVIVLKADGAVAWTTGAEPAEDGVHLLDREGSREFKVARLAPHSLTLVGSSIHWTEGGLPRSAFLY